MNAKILRATHDGDLKVAGRVIPCAVLEDGTRVLSTRGVSKAIGSRRTGTPESSGIGAPNIPSFLASKSISSFISNELMVRLNSPIPYRAKHGGRTAFGYDAKLLPQICEVILDAEKAGVLRTNQKRFADMANLLIRGFAHVGIIALVDEATGYQEIRDRRALEAILNRYLRKELAAWARQFPDEFYEQIFRLKNWQWQGMKINRPSVVGRYTNDIVYERLAPGILKELKSRNPKNETGNRPAKHHQWLTQDVGHPALAQHLHATIALMRASATWEHFYRLLQRALPKKNETIPLALEDTEDRNG
ncbi:MAG TPA: P63C domain-containing protein [Thermoguttaceae bacterium]